MDGFRLMVKRLLEKYRPKKLKPVIYRFIKRFATGLALALVWDRFFNSQKLLSLSGHAFFILGTVFFALAWFNYLKLDGMKIHYLNEGRKKQRKTKHKTSAMIDYTEEEPPKTGSGDPDSIDSDLIDENEETKTALLSNLLAGFCFMLPSFVFLLFF
jgi:hypothetical protein